MKNPGTQPEESAARAAHVLELAGMVLALGAMLVLLARACLRLELHWDTFYYHLPFAALHAHMGIPYELPYELQAMYQGYPPLAEFVQGMLWRMTRSVNATGVINYLAFALFLYFAWKHLGARWWLLVVLCLTTPMVLIHLTSSYIDLFTGSLLAMGVAGLVAMLLFDRWSERRLLLWMLGGTAAAAWSKYTATPVAGLLFAVLLAAYLWRLRSDGTRSNAGRQLCWVALGLLLALLPYAKNLVLYHNPTWPVRPPMLQAGVPYAFGMEREREQQAPPMLAGRSQSELFFRSLFEYQHPTSYPDRERWIIDQGDASLAYRSGGFWVVAVITDALAAVLLGFLRDRRTGWLVLATIAVLWCFISVLPQSHALRYFLFLPLTVGTIIAVLWPRVRGLYPATALAILVLIVGEFVSVSKVNHGYYHVERAGWLEAAEYWGVVPLWGSMTQGKTYCVVGYSPVGILMTGPTMKEFHIVERADAGECPAAAVVMKK